MFNYHTVVALHLNGKGRSRFSTRQHLSMILSLYFHSLLISNMFQAIEIDSPTSTETDNSDDSKSSSSSSGVYQTVTVLGETQLWVIVWISSNFPSDERELSTNLLFIVLRNFEIENNMHCNVDRDDQGMWGWIYCKKFRQTFVCIFLALKRFV